MEPSRLLNLHSIVKESTVNGPGIRSVVWFQGCNLNCKGCFNEPVKELKQGNLLSVDEVIEEFPLNIIEGVTISGGEPFLQIDQLYELAKEIKRRGLTLMIYTGYKISALMLIENSKIEKILELTDVLVDGPYVESCEATHPWAGSGNQNIYFFGDVYTEYQNLKYENLSEIIITDQGEIIETGFVNIL